MHATSLAKTAGFFVGPPTRPEDPPDRAGLTEDKSIGPKGGKCVQRKEEEETRVNSLQTVTAAIAKVPYRHSLNNGPDFMRNQNKRPIVIFPALVTPMS